MPSSCTEYDVEHSTVITVYDPNNKRTWKVYAFLWPRYEYLAQAMKFPTCNLTMTCVNLSHLVHILTAANRKYRVYAAVGAVKYNFNK
jgi:hypothetical protein